MVTAEQHQAALNRQKQAQADNAAQSSAFWALRAGGKVEAAAQMANPISTQTYNIRGEEIIVLGKGIKSEARIAAEKRSEEIQAELQYANARNAQMISVADNSKNLPNFDAQNQIYQVSSNNVVNPSSLFPNQPVVTNGQSQNSTMDYGVNTNANYNDATAMNDYQSANPNSSVNHGQTVNPAYYTAGLSSIPYDNDTSTSLLGGDIQHQESDVNTNLEYELPLSQQSQSNVNWADKTSLGIATALGASIAGLYLWDKRK